MTPAGKPTMSVRLLIATTNPGKLGEVRAMLEGLPVQVVTLDDFPSLPVPIEDQETLEENARLKALYYARSTDCLTLADDSGLEVEALGVAGTANPDWPVRFHAGSVEAGNLIFLSACDGLPADTVERQVVAALDKGRAGLAEAGASMDNIVKTSMMLKHIEDYPKMRHAEVEYYEIHAPHLVAHPPVSTFVQLPEITGPGSLFQIDVMAAR